MAGLFKYSILPLEDVLQIASQLQLMGLHSFWWTRVLAINIKLLSRIWLSDLVTNICTFLLQY